MKNFNITSQEKNKNESITSDQLLIFKPKNLRATDYIREKRRRPDTNAICDHLKKIETSNIDKETIGNIIPELINQKISKNKKSVYEDSFRLMTGKEKETDKTTLRKMITNLILVSTLISSHLLTEMNKILFKKFHQLENP